MLLFLDWLKLEQKKNKMINLLPKKEKNLLKQEENLKIISILGIIMFFSLLSFALMLFAIKFHIMGDLDTYEIFLEQKEFEISLYSDLEEEVEIQNLRFSNLQSFYLETTSRTYILEKISENLPFGTFLKSLNLSSKNQIQPKDKQILKAALTGFSPDRKILENFRSNLESEVFLENVYFPPSNWVTGENNIDFSVSFDVNLNELQK